MPKKPRERYYQSRGQPHKGLDNPEKYGLTFEEVVELIDNGEWPRFARRWREQRKKERYIIRLDFTCPECSQRKEDFDLWGEKLCKECAKEKKSAGGKKSVMYSQNTKCTNCNKSTGNKVSDLCNLCLRSLKEIRGLIANDSRSKESIR